MTTPHTPAFRDMSDFELHMHMVILANAASKAYAANPDSPKAHLFGRYFEIARAEWSKRQFITMANGV